MNRTPVATWPFAFTAIHESRLSDLVLDRIALEVGQLCTPIWNWRAVIQTLTCALDMNKVEAVAWMQVLRKALLGEREDSHLRTVQFTAYLAKSILNPDNLDAGWKQQPLAFQADYADWLAAHPHCASLSVRQVHLQFFNMSLPFDPRMHPTLNSVVDMIMDQEPKEVKKPEPVAFIPTKPLPVLAVSNLSAISQDLLH